MDLMYKDVGVKHMRMKAYIYAEETSHFLPLI